MKHPLKISSQNINAENRRIDVLFKQYDLSITGVTPVLLVVIVLVLFYLGFLGLVWTIPFPHLNFLGNYNGYFNWASFIIAGLMFYWYRQSAMLSYFLLIILFGISYGITLIEAAHRRGEVSTRIIYAAAAVTGLFGIVRLLAKRNLGFITGVLLIPLWVIQLIVKPILKK